MGILKPARCWSHGNDGGCLSLSPHSLAVLENGAKTCSQATVCLLDSSAPRHVVLMAGVREACVHPLLCVGEALLKGKIP